MASRGESSSLADMVECDICMEVMTRPQALNCLHHVCKSCCDQLKRVRGGEGVVGVSCPSCREFTPESNIKDSFILNKLLDIYGRKQTRPEQTSTEVRQCMQCDHPDVSCFCTECHIELCKRCEERHLRIPACKHHRVINTEDMNSDKNKPVSLMKYCSKHPTYPIKYNCVPCSLAVCSECKVEEHDIHQTESVEKALKKLLVKAKTHISTIYGRKSKVEQNLKQIRKQYEECQSICAAKEDDIQQHTEMMMAKLRADSLELIEEVKERNQVKMKELQSIESDMENQLASQESLLSWSSTIMNTTEGPAVLCELQDGLFQRIEICANDVTCTEYGVVKMLQDEFVPHKVTPIKNVVGKIQTKSRSVQPFDTFSENRSAESYSKMVSFRTTHTDLATLSNKVFTKTGSFQLNRYCGRVCYYAGKFWCPCREEPDGCIDVYTSSGQLANSIKCEQIEHPRSVHPLGEQNFIVAAENGLFVIHSDGRLNRKILNGTFIDVHLNTYIIVSLELSSGKDNRIYVLLNRCPPTVYNSFKLANFGCERVLATEEHIFGSFSLKKTKVDGEEETESYIIQYSHTGDPLFQYGRYGHGEIGLLKAPLLCTLDLQGSLLVADNLNKRLRVLSSKGQWSVVNAKVKDMYPDVVFTNDKAIWVLGFNDTENTHSLHKYTF